MLYTRSTGANSCLLYGANEEAMHAPSGHVLDGVITP